MKAVTNLRAISVLALLAVGQVTPAFGQSGVDRVDSDTERVPLHTVIPDYPGIARRDRIEGNVQVCFNISRNGYPRRIAVRQSTHRLFEKPAKKAVRQSTWRPLPEGEEVSGIKACRTFRFSLRPRDEDLDQP
jgi:TonB family protein